MISNIPTLRLEKYYDLVELYNKYYSCALKLTKSKNFEVKFKLSEDKKYLVDSILVPIQLPSLTLLAIQYGVTLAYFVSVIFFTRKEMKQLISD